MTDISPARRAHAISIEAARDGFDWENPNDVLDKIAEELDEIRSALTGVQTCALPISLARIEEEVGDLFFALVNFNRKMQIDSDAAFTQGVLKFERRYRALQKRASQLHLSLQALDPQTLDALWNDVKSEENHGREFI